MDANRASHRNTPVHEYAHSFGDLYGDTGPDAHSVATNSYTHPDPATTGPVVISHGACAARHAPCGHTHAGQRATAIADRHFHGQSYQNTHRYPDLHAYGGAYAYPFTDASACGVRTGGVGDAHARPCGRSDAATAEREHTSLTPHPGDRWGRA